MTEEKVILKSTKGAHLHVSRFSNSFRTTENAQQSGQSALHEKWHYPDNGDDQLIRPNLPQKNANL